MSATATAKSANSSPNTRPFVRYGFPECTDNPRQASTLKPINEPIPEQANTASPVYLLTEQQYIRHQELDNPYGVAGATSIATELQRECEQAGRVLYPVYGESDALENGVALPQIVEWLTDFVNSELGVPPEDCTWYFSGNRSIHAHVPRIVRSKGTLQRLKDMATRFCEDTGAELDTGIYSRKRQFRLPGVTHEGTGLSKIEIDPGWSHAQIIRAGNSSVEPPTSYVEALELTYRPVLEETPEATGRPPGGSVFLSKVDMEAATLTLPTSSERLETPLIEQENPPPQEPAREIWDAYNRKEFSPYANASGEDRSVAIVKVFGGAFARESVRDGTTLVPAWVIGAVGCDGEFTLFRRHAPLQLSKSDYEKWDYGEGDFVAIIGGQSRNSRIFELKASDATAATSVLSPEEGGRQAALSYLETEGYDVGASGGGGGSRSQPVASTQTDSERVLPVDVPTTEASELQRRAEQKGIQTIQHTEIARVGSRLLSKYGWDPTWEWFREQYGADFDPVVTWRQLESLVAAYPDLEHVVVPPRPEG